MKKKILIGFLASALCASFAWSQVSMSGGSNITLTDITARNVTATGTITGNLTGNVTGNVTGNLTGDVTGDVTGLTAASIPDLDTSKTTTGVFADARIPNFDTSKVTTGVFDSGKIPATLDTTKLAAITSPGAGTLLCYTDDGKIGKVTSTGADIDTGKVLTCTSF